VFLIVLELDEAKRAEKNAKKFDLNCAHYRPFEFPTLSSFLEVAKLATNKVLFEIYSC
jgi:hypothetical protein